MPIRKAELYNDACPSRDILSLIGSKWSMLLLCVLRSGPTRTGSLRRHISGISQKMLTQTLRDLERNGIVERINYEEVPPRVEYKLTRLGLSLSELIQDIETWVVRNYPRMVAAQSSFDTGPRPNAVSRQSFDG
jgi:DNA-binding HxlR family transcriptional regulator